MIIRRRGEVFPGPPAQPQISLPVTGKSRRGGARTFLSAAMCYARDRQQFRGRAVLRELLRTGMSALRPASTEALPLPDQGRSFYLEAFTIKSRLQLGDMIGVARLHDTMDRHVGDILVGKGAVMSNVDNAGAFFGD